MMRCSGMSIASLFPEGFFVLAIETDIGIGGWRRVQQNTWPVHKVIPSSVDFLLSERMSAGAARVQGIYQNVGGNLDQSTRGLVRPVDLIAIGVHERLSHVCRNLPYAQ